jgi:hypothetical protein
MMMLRRLDERNTSPYEMSQSVPDRWTSGVDADELLAPKPCNIVYPVQRNPGI